MLSETKNPARNTLAGFFFWLIVLPMRMQKTQRGNVLFLLLLAIVLLGALSNFVAGTTRGRYKTAVSEAMNKDISVMFQQVSAIQQGLEQMAAAGGIDPATLYSNVSTLTPGAVGFDIAPHQMKIFHPQGGGVDHIPSASATSTIAYRFDLKPRVIITGIGPTDATTGDIVFTALIGSAEACGRINERINGSSAVPDMRASVFDDLFASNSGLVLTVAGGDCLSECVNIARICVKSDGANAWGFYAALFPG